MPEMETPSLGALFTGFFSVGIIGFGGVLPFVRRMVVEQRRWLTAAEFTDTLALCQFLPGPNVTNMAVVLGAHYRGARGAAAAVLGLLAAPIAIIVALGAVYDRYGAIPAVAHGLIGLASAAAGLIVATSLKIALPLRHSPRAVATAAAAFLAVALLRLPLLPTLAVLVPASIGLQFWRGGK
jgi:chromate transporter